VKKGIREKKEKKKMKRLTPFQEREVSARLEQGLTYEQIATLFGRARGTVNNDFYFIHKTLGIKRTCELVSRFAEYRKLYPERIRRFV
jgi:DNA-binding CsgD family transcriptional regulator